MNSMLRPHRNTTGGFTLLETLVGTFIFVAIALSAYRAFGTLMDAVAVSRAKIAATSLANEQFEIIRNLPYTDVGIVNGIPSGKIAHNQTITRDNYTFTIVTTIRSIDDPFDGTIGGSPSDNSPADYKMADLDISCTNCRNFSTLNFTTLVAPHALETASTNGALFVQVFDSNGVAVPNASVHIVNTATNPDTIVDDTTDNTGYLKIIDAPPGTNAYNITVSKSGYSTDQTYPIGGAAGANPLEPDATVVVQQVTQTSLSIDKTSTLAVHSVDATCTALPSIGFSLTGAKLIGTPSVLKYGTHTFTTDASGANTVSGLEWDTYATLLTSSSYDLAGTSLTPTFDVNPGESKSMNIIAVPHVDRALLVSVVDSNNNPIDGASVELSKTGFDQTLATNQNAAVCATPGQVFWNGLTNGTYTLNVSASGYQSATASVNVSAAWQAQSITLTP